MTTETPPIAPTPASQWRRQRQEGDLIRLPGSGNVARMVRPNLLALASTSNGVPNPLSARVLRLMAAPPARDDKERVENVKRNALACLEIAALCLIEPRLVFGWRCANGHRSVEHPETCPTCKATDWTPIDPGEGEIGPQDLTNLDLSWIYYGWVEGAASEVAPFRVGDRPD